MHVPPSGVVTLLTDFGLTDPYVGIMKGMVKRTNPRADVFDLCHEVPPQDVEIGAFFLGSAIGRFPAGTVHVGVVDPGVGSARRAIAIAANECYWVGPDNGLFDAVLTADPKAEVREVDPEKLRLTVESHTFHGRDVFAPLAGLVSAGRYGFSATGQRVSVADLATREVDDDPRVLHVDAFGNLITTVAIAEFEQGELPSAVEISGRRVPLVRTYADAERGELLALFNSYGLLEVAARDDRADEILGVTKGAGIVVSR